MANESAIVHDDGVRRCQPSGVGGHLVEGLEDGCLHGCVMLKAL